MGAKNRMHIGAPIRPGERQAFRERADGSYDAGVVREIGDGRPIPEGAELIRARKIDRGCGHWYESETLYRHGGEAQERSMDGPAQVATDAYRKGHDRIFGKRQKVGLA